MPADLKDFVTRFEVHPLAVVVAICVIYVVLGTAMEELSMILLTVPIFFPLILHLGFDPIWFGVLIVMVVMLGMISPPVGMNLFVLNTLLPDVPLRIIFRGVWPFVIVQMLCLALLIALPQVSLWLANKVG
jgi:C4-dicarboxylate transporter, DctM subunit